MHERKAPTFVPSLDVEISDNEKRRLQKELVYLKDPLKLAGQVRTILTKHDFDKALAMTRLASKDIQCTVAWNHIIDYLMSKRATKAALKVYNEMKKRAIFPDSHTIVLIMRGMANGNTSPEDVGQAVALYHSLSAPNSRIQKSIIQTNATLKVCAMARDMDSLWSVVGSIPDKGREAADTLTFTIILNAIRENAIVSSNDLDKRARIGVLERAVQDGKRIWEDIIGKWREGKLRVDEALVCAMGRLLLIGERPRDWDDVLSLMEQTMNISRLAPKVGSDERHTEHLYQANLVEQGEAKERDIDDELSATGSEVFTLKAPTSSGSGLFATPGRNTLSVVLESCNKMKSARLANEYWAVLTDREQRAIAPDLDNYHTMFRILRTSRASGRATELLGNISTANTPADQLPRNSTFLIVMSTCMRDKNNPNVMDHAGRVVDYMERCLPDLIVRPLSMYLDLAMYTNTPTALTRAYARLSPLVKSLKSSSAHGTASDRRDSRIANEIQESETLSLFQSLIGCIDAMMNRDMIPTLERKIWQQRRSALAAYVTKRKTMKHRKGRGESMSKERERFDGSPPRKSNSDARVDPPLESQSNEVERDIENLLASEVTETDSSIDSYSEPTAERSRRHLPNPPNRPMGGIKKYRQESWVPRGKESTERYYAERKRENRRSDRQLRHFRRNEAIRTEKTLAAGETVTRPSPRQDESHADGRDAFADFPVEVGTGRVVQDQKADP